MYARKVKRKCSVRGCKCIDSYAISLTRESGNTIIACKKCLNEAIEAIKSVDPVTKSNIPAIKQTAPPPLFFHPEVEKVEEASVVGAEQPAETTEEAEETTAESYVCPTCGKTFGSNNGLIAHSRYCKK